MQKAPNYKQPLQQKPKKQNNNQKCFNLKKALFLFVCFLPFYSCFNQKDNLKRKQDQDFALLKKEFFYSDSKQLSRISENIECYATDEDKSVSKINAIPKNSWKYFTIDNKMKMSWSTQNDSVILTIEVKDTGIYVDYIFEFINKKWRLVKIIDAST